MSATTAARSSWVPGARGSGFDADHLPLAAVDFDDDAASTGPRVGTRIGDLVLDLAPVAARDLPEVAHLCEAPGLDALLASGPEAWAAVRGWLIELLTDERHRGLVEPHLVPLETVTTRLPFTVADYVDFYASEHHASNVGRIFRPDQEPLLPNWRHLPVGYHGRAGTVVPSGTGVVRPCGQRKDPDRAVPDVAPTTRLDVEAELGFVVGVPSALGDRVATGSFADHVFGVVGLNDWSARDIQAWEYVPLGPFLGKSFATTISAWVTPLDALAAARCDLPPQEPAPLPYLAVEGPAGYDVDVELVVNGTVVSRPPYATTYWSPAQMLAHLTVNGASLRTGDLFASGTISGPRPEERGSLLELTWGWRQPLRVGPGGAQERHGLEDGDTVVLRYSAPGALGGRITLGEVCGTVLPAQPLRGIDRIGAHPKVYVEDR